MFPPCIAAEGREEREELVSSRLLLAFSWQSLKRLVSMDIISRQASAQRIHGHQTNQTREREKDSYRESKKHQKLRLNDGVE